jgi:hypothetical protein
VGLIKRGNCQFVSVSEEDNDCETSSVDEETAAEIAILVSRQDKDESKQLSSSSSSIVTAHTSSVASSPSQRPSPLAPNTPASLLDDVTPLKIKRPSKIQLAATLRMIRHLLAEGYTNKEIIETMQLEERTFYRYMTRIYAQDKDYFEKLDNEAIATEIRLAKERTLKSLRRFDEIAADKSLSAAERIEAERCRGDIVIALAKIEIEGPRIVHNTFRRLLSNENR